MGERMNEEVCSHTWVPSNALCGHDFKACKQRDAYLIRNHRSWLSYLSDDQVAAHLDRCVTLP